MTALHRGTLTLGSVTLGETDASGVDWILEKLIGWDDNPPTTGGVEQRAGEDGAWLTPAYRAARVITVNGSLLAADWDAASVALAQLMASIPLRVLAPMVVDEGAQTLQAMVRQEGDPLTERVGGWVRFSIQLVAPDSRRYGVTVVTASTGLPLITGGWELPASLPDSIDAVIEAGVLTVVNGGNSPAKPVFTVTGPCPPFTLTLLSTGQRLQYFESVPAGRFVTLDTATRTALLDGVSPRYVAGSWFEYEPVSASNPTGSNSVAFAASAYDAAALLTSEHRDAHI